MMRKAIALLAGTMLLPAAANATTFVSRIGAHVVNEDTGQIAADGEQLTPFRTSFEKAGDPAPFDALLGRETPGPTFTAGWTHNYAPIQGTVTGASWTFGIWDIDSFRAGDQVALFTLNGVDLTAALNEVVEGKTRADNQYAIYQLTLPTTLYASLVTGSSTFQLNLKDGSSGGQNRLFNAARLDWSELSITTGTIDPGPGGEDPVPEPATWMMMITGFGLAGSALRRRRVSVRFA